MYRLGIIYQDGSIEGLNFKTKEEAEDYIIKQDDVNKIKRADIINRQSKARERIF